jgi:hypothetical protein
MQDISTFLINAKTNSYVNGDASKTSPSRQGSNDYHYEEIINNKNYIYHDTYFGGEVFIGEEVVYINSPKPIWGMNYYGKTLDKNLS